VRHLEEVCKTIFQRPIRLSEFLDRGTLGFSGVRASYQVVVIAQEVFGMAAIDILHDYSVVIPRNEMRRRSREEWAEQHRSTFPNWDEERINRYATQSFEAEAVVARFESELMETVRAFVREKGFQGVSGPIG
jgi:hypothetical protein